MSVASIFACWLKLLRDWHRALEEPPFQKSLPSLPRFRVAVHQTL